MKTRFFLRGGILIYKLPIAGDLLLRHKDDPPEVTWARSGKTRDEINEWADEFPSLYARLRGWL